MLILYPSPHPPLCLNHNLNMPITFHLFSSTISPSEFSHYLLNCCLHGLYLYYFHTSFFCPYFKNYYLNLLYCHYLFYSSPDKYSTTSTISTLRILEYPLIKCRTSLSHASCMHITSGFVFNVSIYPLNS